MIFCLFWLFFFYLPTYIAYLENFLLIFIVDYYLPIFIIFFILYLFRLSFFNFLLVLVYSSFSTYFDYFYVCFEFDTVPCYCKFCKA